MAAVPFVITIALMAQAPFYSDKLDLLHYLDENGARVEAVTPADWAIRRAHILKNMQQVMGTLPGEGRRVSLDVQIHEETDEDVYIRRRITFAVEFGDRLPAFLLIPKDRTGPVPAVIALHPTSPHGKAMVVGLGDRPNRNYAEELVQRGYVSLAPDYPGFGEYTEVDPYALGYVSATMKGIWNHMRAVDLLQSLPEVDGQRIAAIGHSLGGHNALFLGAFDERVKAMVSSCGFNRFARYYNGDLTGWSHRGYMPRISERHGKDPEQMPFDWTEILGVLAPRPVFVSAPLHDANFDVTGVRECIAAAMPVYELLAAAERLRVIYPDCEHDFPQDAREEAYRFIDSALDFAPNP